MNTGTALISTLLTVLCFSPFILMLLNSKKRARLQLKSLTQFVSEQNCKLTLHEFSGDFAIGLDELKNCLFFQKKTNEYEESQCINLSDMQECKAVTTKNNTYTNNPQKARIEKLDLLFTPKNKQTAIKLAIFDSDINFQLSGELQTIDKWEKMINEKISHLTKA